MDQDHLKNDSPPNPRPLDTKFYDLDAVQRDTLKKIIGITDEEELKRHVVQVQADAYRVFPYPCIRYFTFAKLPIAHLPNYQQILKLPSERPGAIWLDIGCGFGSDLRKAVFDGWPVQNAIACDLLTGLWELGHRLYKTTPSTFPAKFIAGDAFDDNITSLIEPLSSPPNSTRTSLTSLISLNPLRGHVDVIHGSLFFHLFDEGKQLELARRLAALLSPKPGSVIFGGHYGRPEKGSRMEDFGDGNPRIHFWHSPDSWAEIWNGKVFKEGEVKVDLTWAEDASHYIELQSEKLYYIKWCVTRL